MERNYDTVTKLSGETKRALKRGQTEKKSIWEMENQLGHSK